MVVLHHRLKARGPQPRARRCWPRRCRPTPSCRMSSCRSRPSTKGRCVRRGVEAAARLDWPRDKLHIQVLDDSTDETAELARTRGGRAARPGASTSWRCSAPTAAASRAGRCTRRCRRRPTTSSPSSTSTTCRRRDFLRLCMRPFFAEPQTRLRPGALRLPQSARERAHRDADGDARRPSRHRAGDALLGRPSAALQRHLRHLAARARSRPAAAGRATPSPRISISPIAAGSRAGARCS